MKKSLLALAVLGAFAGVAQAQSAVTIYGVVDAGVRFQNNAVDTNATGTAVTGQGHKWSMSSAPGLFNNNRLGFKGVEDLGGGLNAHFALETGFNTANGQLDNASNQLFQRTALVGLGGSWGSLDFGRQYSVAFKTIGAYDPFGFKYPNITLGVAATAGAFPTSQGGNLATNVRNSNDIQYTGKFGPVTANAEYALGENAGAVNTGSSKAIGATFTQDAISAGAAYTRRDLAGQAEKHWTLGGAYTFGPARVTAGYADDKQETIAGVDERTKWAWVGLNYAVTPALEITPAYYRGKLEAGPNNGKKDLYMLSASYALSKRTSLYALVDHAKLNGIATAGFGLLASPVTSQNDFAVGISHSF